MLARFCDMNKDPNASHLSECSALHKHSSDFVVYTFAYSMRTCMPYAVEHTLLLCINRIIEGAASPG